MAGAPEPEPGTGGSNSSSHTELKVAAAALAAAASAPLGIAVAAGAALSSADVRAALRRATVRTLAGAIQAGDQINAAVARRSTSEDSPGPTPAPTEPAPDA